MIEGVTRDFGRLVEALGPYIPDVVVVGGWANRLFLRHPLARRTDFLPLTTDDADVAVPLRLRTRSSALDARLESAGFKEELAGDDRPPVTHYRLGTGEFYVEFLAPTTGSGVRRSGERDATVRVQGIVAQKLPHVDLLLLDPWTVSVPHGEHPKQAALDVRIPNAVTYLAQKLLVLSDRTTNKQANDVVYIHDTLMIFADRVQDLRLLYESLQGRFTKKQSRDLARSILTTFATVDDRIRRAAIITRETGRGAPPSAVQIQDRCRAGLREVFGT